IKARRNEKDGKMFLIDISRRVLMYSFDRVLCSFTSEREFSTYNSPKIEYDTFLFCQLNLMKFFLASYLRSLTLDCK
ncbi:MAG: hypothetical protein WCE93_13865, partial [Nitrososphaeraceae archaeon]